MFTEKAFVAAVEESFRMYKQYGPRSNKKLKPLHRYFAEVFKGTCGEEYAYYYIGDTQGDDKSKEKIVQGAYYDKKVDIAIVPKISRKVIGTCKNGKLKYETKKEYCKRQDEQSPIFCLGIKFVTSNWKQNANNYFENMIGETANIRKKDIPYAHILVLRLKTPYYKKDKMEDPQKLHTLNDNDIQKYILLCNEQNQTYCPSALCILGVDIDEPSSTIKLVTDNAGFNDDTKNALNRQLSIENLLQTLQNTVAQQHNG